MKTIIALPHSGEPRMDHCGSCLRAREITYYSHPAYIPFCRECARSKANIVRLRKDQARVYLSYIKHKNKHRISSAIVADTGLTSKSVQDHLQNLKAKGIIPEGISRTKPIKVANKHGEIILLTRLQAKIYEAQSTERMRRCVHFMTEIASLFSIDLNTVHRQISKLRRWGLDVPTKAKRKENLKAYIKQRIREDGLTGQQLRSDAFLQELGIARTTLIPILGEMHKEGVPTINETLSQKVLKYIQTKQCSRFTRLSIVIQFPKEAPTIQKALDSLVKRGEIACLNPERMPRHREYVLQKKGGATTS